MSQSGKKSGFEGPFDHFGMFIALQMIFKFTWRFFLESSLQKWHLTLYQKHFNLVKSGYPTKENKLHQYNF